MVGEGLNEQKCGSKKSKKKPDKIKIKLDQNKMEELLMGMGVIKKQGRLARVREMA